MRVRIDEAGCDDAVAGIDRLGGAAHASNLGDAPVADGDVGVPGRRTGTVNNQSITDYQIGCHLRLYLRLL